MLSTGRAGTLSRTSDDKPLEPNFINLLRYRGEDSRTRRRIPAFNARPRHLKERLVLITNGPYNHSSCVTDRYRR
jgi:hypothetical protein